MLFNLLYKFKNNFLYLFFNKKRYELIINKLKAKKKINIIFLTNHISQWKYQILINMFNRNGKIVHKQPLALSPHKNDRDRVETYVWKLYRTEWTDNISPGKYQIVVGTEHQKTGISIEIEII